MLRNPAKVSGVIQGEGIRGHSLSLGFAGLLPPPPPTPRHGDPEAMAVAAPLGREGWVPQLLSNGFVHLEQEAPKQGFKHLTATPQLPQL